MDVLVIPTPVEDVPVDQRGLTYGPLYRMLRDNNSVPSATMFQLEGRAGPSSVQLKSTGPNFEPNPLEDSDSDNIPNEYELSYHLHIQDAT